jgi:hypothetical protein
VGWWVVVVAGRYFALLLAGYYATSYMKVLLQSLYSMVLIRH